MTKIKLVCRAMVGGQTYGCGQTLGEAAYPPSVSEREAKEKHEGAYICDDCAPVYQQALIEHTDRLLKSLAKGSKKKKGGDL